MRKQLAILCVVVLLIVSVSSVMGDDWTPGNMREKSGPVEEVVPDWKKESQARARAKAEDRRATLSYRRATGYYDRRREANYDQIRWQQTTHRMGYNQQVFRSRPQHVSCTPSIKSLLRGW